LDLARLPSPAKVAGAEGVVQRAAL
jgi:hypothetical protein